MLVPRAVGVRRAHRGGARHRVVGGPAGAPRHRADRARLARAARRRLPLPRRRAAGARRHLVHVAAPARRPRSSAAPARARRRCSTSCRACSTSPPARCSSTASTSATSTPSCCGAASASCRRSRTCSPGTVASNLRYGKPDATDDELWEALEIAQAADFVRGDARRARRADRPGRHQRVGRPAPAPRHRPGAGAPARRSTSSTTRSRRSTSPPTPACGPRSRRCTADAHGDRRGPAGVDDHRPPTRSSCSRTAATVGLGTHRRAARDLPDLRRDRRVADDDGGGGMSDAASRTATSRRRTASRATATPSTGRRRRSAPARLGRSIGMPVEKSKDFGELDAPPARPDARPSGSRLIAVVVAGGRQRHADGARAEDPRPRHQHHRRRASSTARRHRLRRAAHTLLVVVGASYVGVGRAAVPAGRTSSPASCSARCSGCAPTSRTSSTACRSRYVDRQPRGDLLSRVTNDIDNVAQSLQQTLSQLLTSMLTLVGVLDDDVHRSRRCWRSSRSSPSRCRCFIDAGRSPSARRRGSSPSGATPARSTPRSRRRSPATRSSRCSAASSDVEERFGDKNDELYEASFGAQFISGIIQPAMMFLGNLNYVAIAVDRRAAGGVGSLTHRRHPGVHPVLPPVHPAAHAARLDGQRAAVGHRLGRAGLRAARRRGAVARPRHPLDRPPSPQGRVEFDHVSFSYDPTTR